MADGEESRQAFTHCSPQTYTAAKRGQIDGAPRNSAVRAVHKDSLTARQTLNPFRSLGKTSMSSPNHSKSPPVDTGYGLKRNTLWTVEVTSYGSLFYITDIPFEDIARAAAKGIGELPKTRTRIFYAQPGNDESD